MIARAMLAALATSAVLVQACSRAPRPNGAASEPSAKSVGSAEPDASALPSAIFSAPIAGARVGTGEAIAAGLSVATKTITAVRIDAAGREAWRSPLLAGITWSQDAELHAWPIAAGAFVVWRGPMAGKSAHVGVVVAPDGHIVDGPFDVGSLVCATDDGAAWSEAGAGGTRVKLRTWGAGPSHEESSPPIAGEITLTCGGHQAYAVVDGDEAMPTRVITVGGGAPALDVAANALGRDEERDLFAWAEGTELGLVRIAQSGAVTTADVLGGALSPVREGARVAPEDDVVAVDADERAVALVTSHDESDACPDGRGGSSVHALRIPRRGAAKATTLVLSPAACGRDVGPFWTNVLGQSLVVAWTERASRKDKTVAPIVGLAYRALEEGATLARVPRPADAIADAGCDATKCYAVALVREPGSVGMSPEAMRLVAYP